MEKLDRGLVFLKKNYIYIILAVLLLGAGIRFYYFNKTVDQALWWDEADYMSYAKRIGKGLDINDIWYYRRTFFLPLLWGGMFKFGFGEAGIRFTEVLFSLGLIFFGYLAGKELFNKTVGLIVATGLTFSRLILFLGTRCLTAIPSTMFFLIGLMFFWKGYVKKQNNKFIWLAGLFIGLAIFTRFALFLSLIPFVIYIFLNEKFGALKNKHLWIFLVIILLILTPFFVGYSRNIKGGISGFIKHYTNIGASESEETTEYMGISGIWGYIKSISLNIGLTFSVFALIGCSLFLNLLGIDKIFSDKQVKKTFFILIWILTPLIFHGMYSEYVQERYMLWIYPAILMLAGLGITKSYYYFKKLNKNAGYIFMLVAFVLILFSSYGQIKMGDELIMSKVNSYYSVKEAGIWMKENSQPWEVIMSNSIPQIQYYSERATYMPSNATHLESLEPKYIMLSIFENSPQWFFEYPANKKLYAVWARFLDVEQTKPEVVIFEAY